MSNLNDYFIKSKTNDENFLKCSNERLQLLQSVCASAAAATILLGKPTVDGHKSDLCDENCKDLDESGLDQINKQNKLNNIKVTSELWCPITLRTKNWNLIPSLHVIGPIQNENQVLKHKLISHVVVGLIKQKTHC